MAAASASIVVLSDMPESEDASGCEEATGSESGGSRFSHDEVEGDMGEYVM